MLRQLSKAITDIAYSESQPEAINKKLTVLQYLPRTPDQHAAFLESLSHEWDEVINVTDTQTAFGKFYAIAFVDVLPTP